MKILIFPSEEFHGGRGCHELVFRGSNVTTLPGNMDIQSIKITGADPEKIEKVELQIGPDVILTYEGDEIRDLQLPGGKIYFSRTCFVTTRLKIYFKQEYLDSHAEYGRYVDEYRTVEEVGDELMTFKGLGDEIHEGYIYTTRREPTGRKCREFVGYKGIEVPEIEVTMCEADESLKGTIETEYWEKASESIITSNTKTLEECGDYKDGMIRNRLRYLFGMVGKYYYNS